ncbi:succinylglutamate desuccinylase/aspartoacylase family protein [Massilia endophytica]|uniref:succinylglutamate desuccinylase/aspartoacylase family protein n=1 Tax=Massilia endophytica TaxID=2899220 RepID=UPI001E2A855E|nr:succinylglutamate desuccinylase/aspartoacylase family protein [Massilia endophytica]UGQ47046.1 M14 family metallopeptidase [Massilia endophytica]
MQTITHPLSAPHSPVSFQLTSHHYGAPGGRKAYIQASLHADEVPAMLVAHKLRSRLNELDRQGKVKGEIILVPAANPIGLGQVINERPFGRYDLSTGINFNRSYPHYAGQLKERLQGRLGADADANVALIREELRALTAAWQPHSDTATLKKALLAMAIDADIVLDLHCDLEAALHIYAGTPLRQAIEPLAALIQSHATLYTTAAGGEPFDEACSRLWWDLAEHFGPSIPIPPACVAATVELRGEVSVNYESARADAEAILRYLSLQGIVEMDSFTLPAPISAPTPLEGTERIDAPHAGMLVYLRELGEKLSVGDAVADIIDPFTGETTTLRSGVDGVLFTRLSHRYVIRGMNVAKVAGAVPFRSGNLLSL